MKIYFRLLSYARPIEKFAIPFFIFTVLSTAFNLLTFTLLIPILEILFKDEPSKMLIQQMPEFQLNFEYLRNFFYYTLHKVIQSHGKMGALEFVCGSFLASTILYNLFRYLSQRIMEDLRNHTLLNLRKAVFDKVMSFQLGYFSNERKGDVMSKVTSDVQVVQSSITNTLIVFVKEPITLIGYIITLFSMSWNLTLFTIFIIPVSGFVITRLVKRLKKSAHEAQDSFSRMISILDEALSGLRVIKAFNAVDYTKNKYQQENLRYTKIMRSMVKRQELASPVSEVMGSLVVIGIVMYGGSLIFSNSFSLDASTFVAYIAIFSQVLRPAKSMTSSFGSIQHGLASGERVLSLIDTPVELLDKPDAVKVKSFEREIEFKNVSFSYGSNEVLKNVNFKIKKGRTIALVGPSGGGKSTISDLIPRFYDPGKGSILIDGIDLKDCNIESVRAQMGIVNQEPFLFNDTILNNISFGKENATKEEIIQAAKIANAHNFILQTENGYETIIGDRGIKLSGGQKQRISIARAVLRNPPILILDEATSALDTESEKLVQQALDNLMENRTSLVIAHRLSTIQNADEILVVQNGKIIEQGNHRELIDMEDGLYKKLSTLQTL